MNDSEVHLGVHDAKRQRDETVEKLIEFDVSQTDALTTIQTDLMHMKTWITNIETMMTEGVTDVNFPAEQWQSFASQNPLMIALAYRTQSLDQVINMNPLLAPGMIEGANPYTFSGLYHNGQQPLVTFGLSSAMVSTNFVSFMKQQEKEIAKELSCPAPTVDEVKEEENGFIGFLGDVIPTTLHPIIRDRIYNMPSSIKDGYKFTYGAGSHAEVYSLNQALLANPNARPTDFITHVVRSGKKLKPAGMMMPTCPHCNFITEGFEFSSEVKKGGK